MWSSQWLHLKMSFLYVCLLIIFCSYLSSSGCCGNSSTCLTPDRCTVWIEEDPWWGKTTKSHHQISGEICAHKSFFESWRGIAQKQFDILTVVLFWHGSLSLLSFCFYKPAIKWANLQSTSLREEPLAKWSWLWETYKTFTMTQAAPCWVNVFIQALNVFLSLSVTTRLPL